MVYDFFDSSQMIENLIKFMSDLESINNYEPKKPPEELKKENPNKYIFLLNEYKNYIINVRHNYLYIPEARLIYWINKEFYNENKKMVIINKQLQGVKRYKSSDDIFIDLKEEDLPKVKSILKKITNTYLANKESIDKKHFNKKMINKR